MNVDSKKKCIYAYVGCRTTKERNTRGLGINVYRVDSVTGMLLFIAILSLKGDLLC
jgi:hypothetical protein